MERLERAILRPGRQRHHQSPRAVSAVASGHDRIATGAAPLLTSVTAAYLPRNTRPRVSSITIHPPGTVFQRQFPMDPEIAGFEGDTPGPPRTGTGAGRPQGVVTRPTELRKGAVDVRLARRR